jgi:hypothetical protein
MMEFMEWLAIAAGVLIGFIFLSPNVDYILIIIYYALFKSSYGFDAMYNAADDEATYNYYKTQSKEFKTYADYLRIHKAAQPSSYKRFRRYYDSLAKMLLTRTAPITLLPAIIFWSNWRYYLIGVFIIFVGLLAYKRFVERNRAGLYQRLMVFAVIRNYIKDTKKVK